jgi:hypothetical protein
MVEPRAYYEELKRKEDLR